MFKRAFNADRTAGQITVIPAGLAAFVIFDAVLTKVIALNRVMLKDKINPAVLMKGREVR